MLKKAGGACPSRSSVLQPVNRATIREIDNSMRERGEAHAKIVALITRNY